MKVREYPKRHTKKMYLKRYAKKYYAKLRERGFKVFTIVTPSETIMTLKAFNRVLCDAYEAEKKKQEEQKENADAQTTQG